MIAGPTKDMILNVMGYHHFHFDAAPHNRKRSDDVLFAHVTRDTFTALGIFNHTVFHHEGPTTAERKRLWEIVAERAARSAPAGSTVVLTPLVLSGHSLYFVNLSKDYARVIAKIDPKLDDPDYVRGLYKGAGVPIPTKPKLRWHLQYLDLGLLDKEGRIFFVLGRGPGDLDPQNRGGGDQALQGAHALWAVHAGCSVGTFGASRVFA